MNLGRRLRAWLVEAPVGTARYWFCLTVLVSRLGADSRARTKILLIGLIMPVRDRLLRSRRARPTTFDISVNGHRISWLVGPRSDLEVMTELLVLEGYSGLRIRDPHVILDFGSHVGTSILQFRHMYPSARIIGFEPDPDTFRRLQHNTAQLDNVEVHPIALAGSNGKVTLYSAQQSWVSSLRPEEPGQTAVTVDARTVDTLLDELSLTRVDLIKIDIEGAELEVLAASHRLDSVGAIVGELHDRGDPAMREAFFATLSGFELTVRGEVGHHTYFEAVNATHPSSLSDSRA